MIVVVSIAETYVQKVLVSVPDNTKNAEEKAGNYVKHRYHLGDLRLDISQADYLDQSGEVSVSYSDPNEKKYGNPTSFLMRKGKRMSRKSNGIVDAAILYIVVLFFVYIFYMLYAVIKYTVLTAIDKRKRRKNNER